METDNERARPPKSMTDLPSAAPLEPQQSLIGRIVRYRRLLRLRPFDTTTVEGRSAERYRRIAWSTALSMIARVVGMATSLISVPLVLDYLGQDRYGMWVQMSSLVAALGPLDLGIGLGLLTVLSDAYGRNDKEAARRAISTAAAMLTLIASVAVVVFGIAYFFIPWARVFNVATPTAISEAGPAAAILFGSFAIGLPLGITGQVQLAHQSGYISSAWAILGNVGSFIALIAIIVIHGNLPLLVLALTGVGLLAAALNGWFLFRRQRRWLMPRLQDVDLRTARPLLKTGSLFLVLQIAGLAAFSLDNVVIAQLMGSSSVQEYAVPTKLFVLAPTLLSFVLVPLWPAYRESLARGDGAWVKRTLRRSITLAALFNIPSSLFLIVAGPFLLNVWVHSQVHPTTLLMVGLGTWTIMNTLNGPFAMLLNAANVVGFQAVCSILMAVANVTISIYLVQRIGVSGAVYGSVISQLVFILIPEVWYVRRFLRRLPNSPPEASAVA
jgi:O-antigen/teichoic acid export membrane protein